MAFGGRGGGEKSAFLNGLFHIFTLLLHTMCDELKAQSAANSTQSEIDKIHKWKLLFILKSLSNWGLSLKCKMWHHLLFDNVQQLKCLPISILSMSFSINTHFLFEPTPNHYHIRICTNFVNSQFFSIPFGCRSVLKCKLNTV